MSEKHILDDKITLKELILGFRFWSNFLVGQWKVLIVAILIGASLGAAISIFKKPIYLAVTSFVLEESDMGGMGGMSGLASLVGVNLGSLGSSSGLFQGDNIMELYKSDNMINKTLLSPFNEESLLIDRYIAYNKLDQKWRKKVDFNSLDFSIKRENFSVTQDSVVKEISKLIRKDHLSVVKPDRKLTIIKVNIQSKDEAFSKVFNETLVERVNGFYFETKTKKTAENLQILQSQSDSVRKILDQSLVSFANTADRVPNPNPLMQSGTVDARKKQIDISASTAVYSEIVKNLEIAKVNHRNNSPLIQIIDSPRFPLEKIHLKLKKGIVFGGLIAFVLAIILLFVQKQYVVYVKEK